jgi:hypothetical protein
MKGRYDKKAFKRLDNALLTLFDLHLSERRVRLKAPSGEYGSIFVAFKRFSIMSPFHFAQPAASFKLEPEFYVASEAPLFISYPDKRDIFLEEVFKFNDLFFGRTY